MYIHIDFTISSTRNCIFLYLNSSPRLKRCIDYIHVLYFIPQYIFFIGIYCISLSWRIIIKNFYSICSLSAY